MTSMVDSEIGIPPTPPPDPRTPPAPHPCKHCGAPIYWGRTRKGRSFPVNAVPSAAGTVILRFCPSTRPDGRGKTVLARTLRQGELLRPGECARTPHSATCPKVGEWRKAAEHA